MTGVRAWLAPVYGPKRRYEAQTCVRGDRYVGHVLTLRDRLAVAGFVVPRMRAGSMPRVIHVGTTGRTITGEQLGAALLRRVDVEVDAVRPPTVCPKCGDKKKIGAKTCRACSPAAPDPSKTRCPKCAGAKRHHAKTCLRCHRRVLSTADEVCNCGAPKKRLAKQCRSCSYAGGRRARGA